MGKGKVQADATALDETRRLLYITLFTHCSYGDALGTLANSVIHHVRPPGLDVNEFLAVLGRFANSSRGPLDVEYVKSVINGLTAELDQELMWDVRGWRPPSGGGGDATW